MIVAAVAVIRWLRAETPQWLVRKQTFFLLELILVDLALREPLLKDVERALSAAQR